MQMPNLIRWKGGLAVVETCNLTPGLSTNLWARFGPRRGRGAGAWGFWMLPVGRG